MPLENLINYMEVNMKNKVTDYSLQFVTVCCLCMLFGSTVFAKPRGVHATKELKGQEYYMKNCSACHGEGSRGGNMASIKEWAEIFKDNGKELYELHDGEDNIEKVLSYLKSDEFEKQTPKMLKFLQEFAYDSENIPTCY